MQMSAAAQAERHPKYQAAEYVFEAPVRLWHWVHALSFITLATTGFLIANPLSSLHGEASEHFLMGHIRLTHFCAAYVFAIGFLLRIYWAFVGNRYAREIFYLPFWNREWRHELWRETRYYLFLESRSEKYTNHNALARCFMFAFNVLGTIFMICTGFALYSEGAGAGSWQDQLFGWVIPLIGDSEAVHNWHNMGMWVLSIVAVGHIYAAFRGDIMSRQTHSSTIISGYRMYKDDLP